MGNKSHLTVYKASAGSGKTFRLAVQYIAMLINNPESYRSILAVTFTNKATAEMKQRIMSQLYGIGHGLRSSDVYYNEIKAGSRYDSQTIRHNALLALDMILQDYGNFRVETIDSFFQTVLRGLARELNIGGSLTLELDTDTVISEAVDAFLAGVEQDTADKRNIMKFVESNMENDRGWSIDQTLKKFSKELFSEIFMEHGDELRRILTENPDAVSDYRQNIIAARDKVLPEIEEGIKAAGQAILNALSQAGAGLEDLGSNPRGMVKKIIDASILSKDLPQTVTNCIKDPDTFFNKPTLKKAPYLSELARDRLAPELEKTVCLYNDFHHLQNSYDAALQYLHELSLLLSIRGEIDRESREQGRFILADTPQLLHQMEESDTSFVYEKTGSFIRHLMIDEFQDTSNLQWSNLYLLMLECLSYGQDCLVVGDVKQSIYRWRNSDWNILNTGMERQLAQFSPAVKVMDVNRRSQPRVIEFNNTLFPKAVEVLSQHYKEVTGHDYPALAQSYSGVIQKWPENKAENGYVYAEVINEKFTADEVTDAVCNRIAEHLDRLIDAGVQQTDIAILCRKKEQITNIAGWFAQNRPEFRMISGEAFQLDSSAAVRILINTLRWLADGTDRIALAHAAWEYECFVKGSGMSFDRLFSNGLENCLPQQLITDADALRQLPLYELTEKLYGILELERITGQGQYVMAFLDTVCQWLGRNPAGLDDFITAWDDKLHKTPIPAPDINGIRLLTIHKSKGLEFHTVIVPFCSWPIIDTGHEERLWIKPAEMPFDGMPFIPVAFNTKLGDSEFKDYFNQEAGMQTVDNLNLLYVALTRAVSNLIIISEKPKSGYSIHDVLELSLGTAFPDNITERGIVYETGQICPHAERTGESMDNPFNAQPAPQELAMHSYPINARFRQSGESTRFVHSSDDESGDRQQEYIETGKLMHSLFATIRTEDDIDIQVDRMLRDGLIGSVQEAGKLKESIRSHIESTPGAAEWFSGRYSLFNETSIIFRDGGVLQTRRPDRVMTTADGRAIVVDFKFGREREEYLHQVREYMELLSKMGYTQVEGHIWYIYNNRITDC